MYAEIVEAAKSLADCAPVNGFAGSIGSRKCTGTLTPTRAPAEGMTYPSRYYDPPWRPSPDCNTPMPPTGDLYPCRTQTARR